MKRVYREVGVAAVEGGWEIRLDGRSLKSPARAALVLPTRALAEAVAAEWDAQTDTVQPQSMPMMQLASTTVDRIVPQRAAIVDGVAAYAGTDMLCYRADHPRSLVARQEEAWQPLLDWVASRYDAVLLPTTGIVHRPQSELTLAALRRAVEAQDDWRLSGLQNAVALSGSLVVALALLEGRIDAEVAFAVSQLDESWQSETWGEDAEAAARRAAIRADLGATERFLHLLAG